MEEETQLPERNVEETLTLEEAARFLKIHSNTASKLAESGDLPGRKVGSQWRFLRSALEQYMKQPTTA